MFFYMSGLALLEHLIEIQFTLIVDHLYSSLKNAFMSINLLIRKSVSLSFYAPLYS